MRTIHRVMLLTILATFAPALTACSDFDLDKLDVFGLNEKKKLPGERKEVFPGGVPGVTQGIPPEFVKGNQPLPETAQTAAPTTEADKKTAAVEPEPKPKPKPKRPPKPRTASQPTQFTVQPAPQQQPPPWPQAQQPAQQSQAPWPAQGQPNTAEQWPSSPQPGSLSR